MGINIKLEKAQLADAEMIVRINTAAYNSDKNQFGGGGDGGPPGYDSLEHIKGSITRFPSYKICLGEETIGWFLLADVDENMVELHNFCINPACHNRGYGFAALQLMETLIPKGKLWILGTPHYSVKNQHVYEKAGFKRAGIFEDGFLIRYEKPIALQNIENSIADFI